MGGEKFFSKKYKFCPVCGGEFILKKEHLHGPKRLTCQKCGFVFYINSRPAVSAIIEKEEKILLAKRAFDPFKGEWDIPGGFLEAGEEPVEGLKREIREETGREIKVGKFLGIYIDRYHTWVDGEYTFNIYYLGRLKGEAIAQDDVVEFRWFSIAKLPRVAFENSRRALADYKNKKNDQ